MRFASPAEATGGLEAWRLGGLEAWRLGGLEAWRLGGLERFQEWQAAGWQQDLEELELFENRRESLGEHPA